MSRKGVRMGSVKREEMGVGSIVWIRRRNGSWWPGKVLGPDEIISSHLLSPKSGTPVKLLGKEDASVDWYNLGKSKRVKPFRCGEFDKCIERAKSSLGLPPKKREKYARREDAIIHALELEKHLLGDKPGNLGSSADGYCNKSSAAVKKELVICSENSNSGKGGDVNLESGSKELVVFTEDEDMDDLISPQEINGEGQMGKDIDSSELRPCMSSLQDLGLRTEPSTQKLSPPTALNGFHKLELGNFEKDLPISGANEITAVSGTKSSLKKKRKIPNDALLRRSDRLRPLVHVVQKSEKLPSKSFLQRSGQKDIQLATHAKMNSLYLPSELNDCSMDGKLVSPTQMPKSPSHMDAEKFCCPTSLDEDSASESTESTETDSFKTRSMDSDEDEETVGLPEPAFVPQLGLKSLKISGQLRHGSTSSDSCNDNGKDMSHLYPDHPVAASLGVSKWQMKGKRNKRRPTRRSNEETDRWVAGGSMYTADLEKVEGDSSDDFSKRNIRTRRPPSYNLEYNDVPHNQIDWMHLAWNEEPLMGGYWEGSSNHLVPELGGYQLDRNMEPGLVDVDLKVQSSYPRERVPLISLLSKLNGKAIVGHPIQVEILEDGSTDSLLSPGEGDGIGPPEISCNDTAVHSVLRTARRSANFPVSNLPPLAKMQGEESARRSANFSKPHLQPLAKMQGEESTEHFQNVNHNKKTHFRKSGVGHKSSLMKRGLSHGKISEKPQKDISLSSNQKIRNLSEICREPSSVNHLRSGNNKSFQAGGSMKDKPVLTAVACVPLKLIFSRLNEELVGHRK